MSSAYLLAVVGTVGTTITPWGQAFIQSYCADKRLSPEHLRTSRFDVALGSFLTNTIAAFIVIAAAATLWAHGERSIPDAAAAAKALGPLAGHAAETVFALGLLGAAFLGLGVVPLTSSYATTEALGLERGLDLRPRQAPAFYGLLAFFLGAAAVLVLIPGLPLIRVMFLAQVVNGLLLPIILVFVMLLSRRRKLLGELTSGPLVSAAGWFVTWSSARCRSRSSSPTCCRERRPTPAILHLSLVTSGELNDADGRKLGRIEDLVVRLGERDYPPISGAVAKVAGRLVFVRPSKSARSSTAE